MNAIASIFMVWFIVLVFYHEQKNLFFYILVMASVIMAVLIPVFGIASKLIPALVDAYFFLLVTDLAICIGIYFHLAIKAFQARATLPAASKVSRVGMLSIGLCCIFLLCTYGSFIMQELPGVIPEFKALLMSLNFIQINCTYFITFGWCFAAIALVMLYVGYIMPDWLRRRIQGSINAKA